MSPAEADRNADTAEVIKGLERVAACYDALEASMPDFHRRRAQQHYSEAVVRRLLADTDDRLVAIESGTGTGKTIAYLIGGLIAAEAEDKSLVIATATTKLQDQLLGREIPAVRDYAGLEAHACVAKGRGRYVDVTRAREFITQSGGQSDLLGGSGLGQRAATAAERATVTRLIERWDAGDWDGCLDSLDEAPPDAVWHAIKSTRHSCAGPARCRDQGYCAFHRARRSMGNYAVIIANHDLLLSDLALGGGVVLPDPAETFYLIDEGHHLAGKAIEHGAASAALDGIVKAIHDLDTLIDKTGQALNDTSLEAGTTLEAIERETSALRSVAEQLPIKASQHSCVPTYRAPAGDMPEPVREAADRLAGETDAARQAASKAAAAIDKHNADDGGDDTLNALRPALGEVHDRLVEQTSALNRLAERTEAGAAPIARWIEAHDDDYHLHAAPVSGAGLLRDTLWSACAGALVTSATLTSTDGWRRFAAKTGLAAFDGVHYECLPSPFDYIAAATLHVPAMASDGAQAQAHTDELTRLVPAILEANPVASLVLCMSWRQLNAISDTLPDALRRRARFQGEASREALTTAHRQAVDHGEASVLVGLASFAEGVDLEGRYCEQVVITKLPFAPPDSPIAATQAEWLQAHNRSPFHRLAVPEAGVQLAQAAGRLLRTETDSGRVVILDRRIVTKPYGATLLNALPAFRHVIE